MKDETYQPQFRYKDAEAAQAASRRHPPTDEYLGLAIGVLERVRERFGSESQYHEAVWGRFLKCNTTIDDPKPVRSTLRSWKFLNACVVVVTSGKVLTRPEADAMVRDWLKKHSLMSKVKINWSSSHLVTSFGAGCLNLVDRPGYYRTHRSGDSCPCHSCMCMRPRDRQPCTS